MRKNPYLNTIAESIKLPEEKQLCKDLFDYGVISSKAFQILKLEKYIANCLLSN